MASPTVLLQYILPKRLLTGIAGRIARARGGSATGRLVKWFVRRYKVDLSEAEDPGPAGYGSFNEFFTRPLKPGMRPIADADFVSPVDGAISRFGAIEDRHMIQAKGHLFTTTDLLAGDAALAEQFNHGSFANLYLSPRDYHRVHMPCDGRLKRMIHVPGALFSVNPATARGIPRLFARNERVVCMFDSPVFGSFAMVLVGATIVGSMATVWHGTVRPPHNGEPTVWTYGDQVIELAKGEEMGRFLLGSTVVMLFPPRVIDFNPDWAPERPVRLGEEMGKRA